MIIRIDDSVFTVDESEAYTVLRLIKKILIPKIEESVDAIESVVDTANNAMDAVEQVESEIEALQNMDNSHAQAILTLNTGLQTLRNNVNHIVTDDIPNLELNKLDKTNSTVENWKLIKSTGGNVWVDSGATFGVTTYRLGKCVMFSFNGSITNSSEGSSSTHWAIEVPSSSSIFCYGTGSVTGQVFGYTVPFGGRIMFNKFPYITTSLDYSTGTPTHIIASFGGFYLEA